MKAKDRVLPPMPVALTQAELDQSLDDVMADRRDGEPLWVFGYGSLIWKPELHFSHRLPVRVHGYHRSLCLWSRSYRGTPECPGLVAGLDRGGSCMGVALRLAASNAREEFAKLWRREMLLGSYEPRWLRCSASDGVRIRALAFVVRRDGPHYAGDLHEDEILNVFFRGSCGSYGTSLEYLVNTVRALREHGIADPHLERLARHAGIDPQEWRIAATKLPA